MRGGRLQRESILCGGGRGATESEERAENKTSHERQSAGVTEIISGAFGQRYQGVGGEAHHTGVFAEEILVFRHQRVKSSHAASNREWFWSHMRRSALP